MPGYPEPGNVVLFTSQQFQSFNQTDANDRDKRIAYGKSPGINNTNSGCVMIRASFC